MFLIFSGYLLANYAMFRFDIQGHVYVIGIFSDRRCFYNNDECRCRYDERLNKWTIIKSLRLQENFLYFRNITIHRSSFDDFCKFIHDVIRYVRIDNMLVSLICI